MRWFRHTIAEYRCTRCARGCQVVAVDLSPFLLAATAGCTLPLCVVFLRAPWDLPWYDVFGVFAGELLLLYASGFISSLLAGLFDLTGTQICRSCGARVRFAGRHFDPKGSLRPHWKDFALWVVFIGLNVTVWLAI